MLWSPFAFIAGGELAGHPSLPLVVTAKLFQAPKDRAFQLLLAQMIATTEFRKLHLSDTKLTEGHSRIVPSSYVVIFHRVQVHGKIIP